MPNAPSPATPTAVPATPPAAFAPFAARRAAPAAPPAAAPGDDAARALTIFACLWAFASLFHQAAYPHLQVGRSALFVTIPAVWVLLRPSSLWRFVAMLGLQIVSVLWNGPAWASNHWLFTTAVNATFLLALAGLVLRERGRLHRVDGGALLRAVAPVVRVELLVLYAFAVLHKLNTDFLDPVVSCASTQYARIAGSYPLLPSGAWIAPVVIYGTLAVELAIPLLLCLRRTRLLGLLLGVGFHFVLTLNPAHVFFDFTSMLVAVYFLFVPFDYWTAWRARPLAPPALQRLRERAAAARPARLGRGVLVALALLLLAAYAMRLAPDDPNVEAAMREGVRIVWVLYFVALLTIFLRVARQVDVVARTRPLDGFRATWAGAWVMPALLVLNGLSPYLGLKTESSFAMFSNLRTEGGESNHLVMPAWLQVAGYQRDLVRPLASSDRTIQRVADRDRRFTWFDFRARTSRLPADASVSYERAGVTHVVPRVADVPELAVGPSTMAQRFLRFRIVEAAGAPVRCLH